MQVIAIARDWSKSTAMRDSKYPQSPFAVIDIPITDAYDYIVDRVAEIEYARNNFDVCEPCTPEERWQTADTFAVMKGKNKRSTKNHDNIMDAELDAINKKMLDPKNDYWVETRPANPVRCQLYCNVNQHCKFWQEWTKNNQEENDGEA